jgi:hypothetical protein
MLCSILRNRLLKYSISKHNVFLSSYNAESFTLVLQVLQASSSVVVSASEERIYFSQSDDESLADDEKNNVESDPDSDDDERSSKRSKSSQLVCKLSIHCFWLCFVFFEKLLMWVQ